MRNFEKEDQLFIDLKPKIISNLKYKLLGNDFFKFRYYDNSLTIEEDLYHDSFIVYRHELNRKGLILNENITEHELIRNIWQIVLTRFYLHYNGKGTKYFEYIASSGFSLNKLLETLDDTAISHMFSIHSEQMKCTVDIERIIKKLYSTIEFKDYNILSCILDGYNQKEIAKKLRKSEGRISNLVREIRSIFLDYLDKEFKDFKENIYEITDKRVLRSDIIKQKYEESNIN